VTNSNRQSGIETLRTLAMFAVVGIHTNLMLDPARLASHEQTLLAVLTDLYSWAVPFFFMVSGYFFTTGWHPGTDKLPRYAVRFVPLMAIWYGIEATIAPDTIARVSEYGVRAMYWRFLVSGQHFLSDPISFVFTPFPWFLLSLLIALTLLEIGLRLRVPSTLALLGFVLYALCSAQLVLGRLFLGIFCVAMGSLVARNRHLISSRHGFTLLAAALPLQVLIGMSQVPWWYVPYFIPTLALALGVLLVGLSRPGLGSRTWLPLFGRLTLGMYLAHIPLMHLFDGALRRYLHEPFAIGVVVLPMVVFLTTAAIVWLVTRLRAAEPEPVLRPVELPR
jgi:surface polysaccharide O-acyltransferase-like enzyme